MKSELACLVQTRKPSTKEVGILYMAYSTGTNSPILLCLGSNKSLRSRKGSGNAGEGPSLGDNQHVSENRQLKKKQLLKAQTMPEHVHEPVNTSQGTSDKPEIQKVAKKHTGETTMATSILVGRQLSEALRDKI